LWGAPRIHGELLKLGFEVAQSSVAKYMVKRCGPPSQGWRTFLRNHAPDIAAMDLFVVPTMGFDLLYVFVIVRLARRDLVWINVTTHPNAVGGARRQAAVLARVAEKAAWGGTMPKDVGLGVATTFGQERDMPTWVACVARVRVDRASGGAIVEKLTLVVDAGTIVHPDGAKAQVEGAALWGLSMALHEGSEFVNGLPKDTNLDTYTPLRMGDVPEMDIEFLPSTEVPTGLGEPATTVVGPAIGNAIFAATGARLRHLPIRPDAVLRALNTKS
jgi:CO/xanthine dehydrogenase Mo-binding subunit